MSKIGTWSTVAGNNNSSPPDGWPEGQPPSTVNDCAREMMASIRTAINDLEFIDFANTPSYLTATAFSMATADVANFQVGRRVKLFDATTLYGTIVSVSASFVEVQLDSGALTTSLSSVALSIIKPSNTSLPGTVWKRKNAIINGNMDIWQRSASFSSVAANTYTADRFQWLQHQSSTVVVNVSRIERSATLSNVPTVAQAGILLTNALRISVSTVDATIASAEYAALSYKLEGYDWRQLAHQPMNLSFWVNTNKSGVYACAFRNASASVSFVQNYTISTINTWQKFSIPVPAAPASPYTWDYSSGVGLQVTWTLAAGGNLQTTAGEWTSTNAIATSSQVNFLANANNVFSITGIQLEEGQHATPLEYHNPITEKRLCSRYYQHWPYDLTQNGGSSTEELGGTIVNGVQAFIVAKYKEGMRSTPTATFPTFGAGWAVENLNSTDFVTSVTVYKTVSTHIAFGAQTGAIWTDGTTTRLFIFGSETYAVRLDAEL